MLIFEWIVAVLFIAVLLAAAARRLSVPYPTLLALGGVALSFVPAVPNLRLDPELALALFVAPILLSAGFDTSLRDLKAHWKPIFGLAVGAVFVTIAAVAVVAKAMVPAMPWSACIVLGAIVAPPDAVAALSVLRQVSMPQRLVTILRGESLLNDAASLLVYRLGVAAAVAQSQSDTSFFQPLALVGILVSVVVGPVLGRLSVALQSRVRDPGTAIVLQFAIGFALWLVAERIGLSSVLTVVTYALMVARYAPEIATPRSRVVSYAVWDTAVFVLNVLAFVLIGIQIEPALERIGGDEQRHAFVVALVVFGTVFVVRLVWSVLVSGIREIWSREGGEAEAGPWPRPALAVAWSGMRGVVTIATALALPEGFPQRDLIIVAAFGVVFGTLVVQGLSLKLLLRVLELRDDDPVGRETGWARARAYEAALSSLDEASEDDEAVSALRAEFEAALREAERNRDGQASDVLPADPARRRAIAAAREAVIDLRRTGEIGDDAFYLLEEEFDWAELSATPREDGS